MADDFSQHKDDFLKEAAIHVESMNSSLLRWEKDSHKEELLYEIFRSAHTLKSISAAMGYKQVMQLAHAIEDVLDAVRHNAVSFQQVVDLLFECFDALSANLREIAASDKEINTEQLTLRIRSFLQNDRPLPPKKKVKEKLDLPVIEKLKSVEVKVEKLDVLMKLMEELLVSRIKLELLREEINNHELSASVDTLGRHLTEMQYNIMQIRMVPIGFIFNRFPRLIRDLAKQQKKEVNLEIEGADIELDRSLIDELAESLTHLIRNAVDHGLESPQVRMKENKKAQGTIRLSAKRSKEFVTIIIQDDGQGLDMPAIEKVAIKDKVLLPEASAEEIAHSIFKGISTTKTVTDVSGRGLGLSIVKQKIESIGGTIQVKSKPKEGAEFHIKIPVSLAVIKVLFVTVSSQTYAIPINNIERLLSTTAEDIKGLLNYNAIVYQGEDIPVTHLSKLFSVDNLMAKNYPIVVIRRGEQRMGLAVDGLLSTQEVVVKPLAKVVKENKYFSGSALIGSGEMVLILDVEHLFLSRRQQNEWRTPEAI